MGLYMGRHYKATLVDNH